MTEVVEVALHGIAANRNDAGDDEGPPAHDWRLSGANLSTHLHRSATYIYTDTLRTLIASGRPMPACFPRPSMSRVPVLTFVCVALGAASIIAACSGGDDTGTGSGASTAAGATSCESTGKKLCERACSCGSGCKTAFKGTSGALTTFTWSNQADCEGAFAGSRCRNGGPIGVDYAQCDADVTSAVCESNAIVDPPSCEARKDGG
jgi:hypothetical protein